MPARGGTADKFGNRYETLWAVDQLLRIVDGAALRLTLEPLDQDESSGVEFVVAVEDGTSIPIPTVPTSSVQKHLSGTVKGQILELLDRSDCGRNSTFQPLRRCLSDLSE